MGWSLLVLGVIGLEEGFGAVYGRFVFGFCSGLVRTAESGGGLFTMQSYNILFWQLWDFMGFYAILWDSMRFYAILCDTYISNTFFEHGKHGYSLAL